MAIEFACAACGATLRVPDAASGRMVRCRKCQATFRAPPPLAPEPPAPAHAEPPKPVAVAPDWAEEPPAPPADAPLPVAEIVADEEPTVPATTRRDEELAPAEEILVPAEEVPTAPRSPRPKKAGRPPRRREREREYQGAPMLRALLTLGVVALVAAVGVGALIWRSIYSTPDWHEHRSFAGGYKAELPADPRDDIEDRIGFPKQPNAGGPAARVEGTIHRRMEYAVIWADFPGGRGPWATDDQIIDAAIQGMGLTGHRPHIEPGQAIRVSGFNGREVLATVPGEGRYVFRIIVAESRLYVVAAGGRAGRADHPDVRRFIDSFEVTDDQLLAALRAREKAAEDARVGEEKRQEAARRAEEERRLAEEKRLDDEKRREDERRAEAERKRREAEAAAEAARREAEAAVEKFRAAQPGLSAPDPTDLVGLVRYLAFEEITGDELTVWPKMPETATAPRGAAVGPGVRGKALYLAANPRGVVIPPNNLPGDLVRKPLTVAGWAKLGTASVVLFRTGTDGNPGMTLTIGKDRVTSYVPSPNQHPEERGKPGTMSAALPADGRWHHVALTRSGAEAGNRTVLYVDGAVASFYAFTPGVSPFTELGAGLPVLQAQRGDVFYKVPHPDLPVAAIDEFCLFDRALAAHEVRFLAGKAKSPEAPAGQAVRLAPHTLIEPTTGVVFDPERKAAWSVATVSHYWTRDDKVAGTGYGASGARLVKYTYPDLQVTGQWELPQYRPPGGALSMMAIAGAPVFDAKNNRLFAPVTYLTGWTDHLQKEAESSGTYFRFDLDKLPEIGRLTPIITESARLTARPGSGWRVGDAAVSPDGKWFYYTDPNAPGPPRGTTVARVSTSLDGAPEQIVVPGHSFWSRPLWLSPDGKTLRVVQSGRQAAGFGDGASGILEVDTAEWKAGDVRPLPGVNWSVATDRSPVTVHPDGRVFAVPPTGLAEYDARDEVRRRPVLFPPNSFLRVSADGRFLFAADAESPRNRLAILDARKNTDRLEELATLEEAPGMRVGGPFNVSPDGRFVVFRSGLVVRVDEGEAALKPLPKWVPPALPEPKKPVVVAPNPKDPGEIAPKPKLPAAVPAATDIKGLTFYLACDELNGKTLKETVSGKFVGQAKEIELIDGPRGKAIRIGSDPRKSIGSEALSLTDQAGVLAVGEGKPFTLAVWVRTDDWATFGGKFVGGTFVSAQTTRHVALAPTDTGASVVVQGGPARTTPQAADRRDFVPTREWVHLAVSRDEKGVVRFGVNGDVKVVKAEPFPHALPFRTFAFGDRTPRPAPFEIDEFCLFDRALSDDELAALAGVKPLPKPASTAAIAPKPREVPAIPAATKFDGLTFYLACDEIEGKALKESVSGKFVGEGQKAELVDGVRGKALRVTAFPGGGGFDLSSQKAALAVAENKPFSIAVWVRRNDPDFPHLVPFYSTTPVKGDTHTELTIRRDTGWADGRALHMPNRKQPGGIETVLARGDAAGKATDWTHVAAVRGEDGALKFYVNGTALRNQGRDAKFTAALPFDVAWIGWVPAGHPVAFVDFDEFCVFNRALTDDEVAALAGDKAAPVGAKPKDPGEIPPKGKWAVKPYSGKEVAPASDMKGLKFHLDFEEIADDKVKDSVSGKQVGKLLNGELVPGPRGKALRLTGGATQVPALNLDDQVETFRVAGDGSFSLGLWVRFVSCDSPNPLAVAFRGTTKTGAAPAYQLWYGVEPDYCRLHASDYPEGKPSGKGGYGINAPQKTPPLGEWFHIVLTRDGKDGIRVWVNGVRQGTKIEHPLPLSWDTLGLVSSSRGAAVVDVDELCLFDRALTDDEIKKLAGLAGKK